MNNHLKKNMKLSKEQRLLIMLNHSARELLQIMVTIQFRLEAYEKPNPEVKRLSTALECAWNAIMLQITEVSSYLKDDEDVLQAYSEARTEEAMVENSKIKCATQFCDADNENDLPLRST